MNDLLPKMLDFNKVLLDFQYKPNFMIRAYNRENRPWILITMLVENARQPLRPWEVKPHPQDTEIYYDRWRPLAFPEGPSTIGYSPSREMIEVSGNYPIPLCFYPGDEDNFISWLVLQVKGVEEHEMDEWLRYKGELIRDPHKEIGT
jgi:hypothetical protein